MAKALRSVVALLCLAFALAACAQSKPVRSTHTVVSWPAGEERRIVVMEADIEIGLLTTGGIVEPRADWTNAAEGHVAAELERFFAAKTIDALPYADRANLGDNPRHVQLVKLHTAVASSVVRHEYTQGLKLPHKRGALDWTLGTGVQSLRDEFGAQYALFLTMRDSFASGGRVALMLGTALLFGAPVSGGQQAGYASLVDLNSGKLVWFNIYADLSGDLRTREGAVEAVDNLLAGLPL